MKEKHFSTLFLNKKKYIDGEGGAPSHLYMYDYGGILSL